jgi:hypothetical protein
MVQSRGLSVRDGNSVTFKVADLDTIIAKMRA